MKNQHNINIIPVDTTQVVDAQMPLGISELEAEASISPSNHSMKHTLIVPDGEACEYCAFPSENSLFPAENLPNSDIKIHRMLVHPTAAATYVPCRRSSAPDAPQDNPFHAKYLNTPAAESSL